MRNGPSILVLTLAIFGTGCGDDAPAFLALDELCGAITDDICSAPKGCCKVVNDEAECVARVKSTCEADRVELVKEDALSYDGVEAARVRSAQQEAVADCGPSSAIASFFEGGLGEGETCERDAQCASGACDGKCVEGSGPALCNDTGGLPPREP